MVGSVWIIIIIHEVGLIGKVGETCTSPKNPYIGDNVSQVWGCGGEIYKIENCKIFEN